eukprot:jgi/Mesvir1/15626/Mv03232-RA.1
MRTLAGRREGEPCVRMCSFVTLVLLLNVAFMGSGYFAVAAEDGESLTAGSDVPNAGHTAVHPLLSELHSALAQSPGLGKSSKGVKSSKSPEAARKDTRSDYMDFLLAAAGRTASGPGPSYTAPGAKKDDPKTSRERAAASIPTAKPDPRGSAGAEKKQGLEPEEAKAEKNKAADTKPEADASEPTHVQLRVTGVLEIGADADLAMRQLSAACKAVDVTVEGRGVYAWVPATMVPCLSTLEGFLSFTPSLVQQYSAGSPIHQLGGESTITIRSRSVRRLAAASGDVVSQGDVAQKSDLARVNWNVTGAGGKVGILADSFDRFFPAGGWTQYWQQRGELPLDLEIIEDFPFYYAWTTDEGRAIAEIVHDVAPNASIAFFTSNFGLSSAADGIRRLAAAGCQVIVSAFQYSDEPFFFDGAIASAANEVTQRGVAYVAAAGNNGAAAYESPFVDSAYALDPVTKLPVPVDGPDNINSTGRLHDFDPRGDVSQPFLRVDVGPQGLPGVLLSLQWDQPWATQGPWAAGGGSAGAGGATSDLNVYIEAGGNWFVGNGANVGGNPLEMCWFYSDSGVFTIYIELASGDAPSSLKFVVWNAPLSLGAQLGALGIASGAIVGHVAASQAVSVGAANYASTPVFDGALSSAVLEPFSSRGGTSIMFDEQGAYLGPVGLIRPTPSVVGPDGVDTSFFSPNRPVWETDTDSSGSPNFFGTSAAAAHVAGLTALLASAAASVGHPLTAASARTLLESSAHDMRALGYDVDSGAGFVDAVALMVTFQDTLWERDASALLAFKQALDAESTADVLDDWVEGGDPCSDGWTGVTCSGGPFQVVSGLSLGDRGLAGTLPASLGELGGLEVLELGGNALSGGIPGEFGRLLLATVIDLRGNQLSGSIPFPLDALRQLVTLDLRDNAGLTGCIPPGVYAATLGSSLDGICGDTLETPMEVPALPFAYSSDTRLFSRDIDINVAGCGGSGPVLGPSAVFQVSSSRDAIWRVSLCDSHYDTFLYVRSREIYDDGMVVDDEVCDDDSPVCGGHSTLCSGYTCTQSGREIVVAASRMYYIIVTGKAANDSGRFTLELAEFPLPEPYLIERERQALKDFKGAIEGLLPPQQGGAPGKGPPPPPPLASWDARLNACAYEGVYCVEGRVVAITLPALGLAGTLGGVAQQPLLPVRLSRLHILDLSRNPGLVACSLGLLSGVVRVGSGESFVGLCGDTEHLAVTIPSLPFVYVDDTSRGFGHDARSLGCDGYQSPGVVFEFVPEVTGMVTFSLCGGEGTGYYTSYDSYVFAYPANVTGANSTAGHPMCDDDGCPWTSPSHSKLSALFNAGVKYYFVVSGWDPKVDFWNPEQGQFVLSASAGPPLDLPRIQATHSALMQIKSGFQDGSTVLTDWAEDDLAYCFWQGVTCDAELEVRKLILGGRGMRGTVPAAIGRLPSLILLSLAENDLEGPIPEALSGVPEGEETRQHVSLDFSYNARMNGCVPDSIAFKSSSQGLPLFTVNVEGSGVGGACRYADMAPIVACPSDLVVENVTRNLIFPQNDVPWAFGFADEGAPNIITDELTFKCTPDVGNVPFFVGTTEVVCEATDADDNVARCSFDVTIVRSEDPLAWSPPPPYLGKGLVYLPGVNSSSFPLGVVSSFAFALTQATSVDVPLTLGGIYDITADEVSAPATRRARSLLQRGGGNGGLLITITFGGWSPSDVASIAAWFNDPNAATAMGLILADVLGAPVGTPTVSASVGVGACCLPPSPDAVCLVSVADPSQPTREVAIASSAECEELGRRLLPSATREAIWLGSAGQCGECAIKWNVRPGARSDPHFVTAKGEHFDWMGEGERSFCIISDKAVHVNAHLFAGTDGRRKGTWMDQIAVLHGSDNIVVSVNAPAGFPGLYGSITINGRADTSAGSSSAVVAKGLTVRRKKTRTWVTVEGILDLEVELVRASTWEAGKGPGRDFLNFRVRGLNATEDVHGVLGQTFRPAAPLGVTSATSNDLVEGADPEYVTSGLLAADCSFSRFSSKKTVSSS